MKSNALRSRFCISASKVALIAALCLIALPVQAQFIEGAYGSSKYKAPPTEIVDTARLVAIYGHWMHDGVLNQDQYEEDMLEIGGHSSLYSSYGLYRVDSLFNAQHPDGGTIQDYFFAGSAIPTKTHSNAIFKDKEKSVVAGTVSIAFAPNVYTEPMPEQDWEITDETSTIQGIPCIKATCRFRGRDWTAWFAPDIPVNDGPWKLHGLPGLIIYAVDSEKANLFAIKEFRNPEDNKEIRQIKVTKNEKAIKTTREKALKRIYDLAMNPNLIQEEGLFTGMDLGSRGFYAPLELE